MGIKVREAYEMAAWPGCCARGRARDMGCDVIEAKHGSEEYKDATGGETRKNQDAFQWQGEQGIKYIPELLRFAGSMVPDPSTTSPRPFIVERV